MQQEDAIDEEEDLFFFIEISIPLCALTGDAASGEDLFLLLAVHAKYKIISSTIHLPSVAESVELLSLKTKLISFIIILVVSKQICTIFFAIASGR